MTEIAPGWDVLEQRTRNRVLYWLFGLLDVVLTAPLSPNARVTFTVRNRDTGETHKITARSREEAAALIARGLFDRE